MSHTILQDQHGSPAVPQSASIQNAPDQMSAPQGSLAIVFTDIVESTQLWEQSATAMKQAMEVHDNMIRSITKHHHGYEVKQNGDGFMLAFQSATAALEFCLDVQKKLMEVEWPAELLDEHAAREVKRVEGHDGEDGAGEMMWRGLRLRMSAHFGEPVCKWNEVIGRMDYFGPMVNRAARFIQVTEGGQMVVSEEFLAELQKSKSGTSATAAGGEGPLFAAAAKADEDDEGAKLDLRDLPCEDAGQVLTDKQFEVRLLGERHFKGLEEMQKLYFIIPYSLRARLQYWPEHLHVPGSKGNLVR